MSQTKTRQPRAVGATPNWNWDESPPWIRLQAPEQKCTCGDPRCFDCHYKPLEDPEVRGIIAQRGT